MLITFTSDFGPKDTCAIGTYYIDNDEVNVNLSHIYFVCRLYYDNYRKWLGHVSELPFELQAGFESSLVDKVCYVLFHEYIHRTLFQLEGKEVSRAFDNIYKKIETDSDILINK